MLSFRKAVCHVLSGGVTDLHAVIIDNGCRMESELCVIADERWRQSSQGLHSRNVRSLLCHSSCRRRQLYHTIGLPILYTAGKI